MLATKCCGCRRIVPQHKNKAKWVGNTGRILRQYGASIKSYFAYPFSKKNENATKEFFQEIYCGKKVDDLIFDGNDEEYLKKTICLLAPKEKYDVIYDCGCGNGSFLSFATAHGLLFNSYIGIDFAIDATRSYDKAIFVREDLSNYAFQNSDKNRLVVLCNSACYLSDAVLNKLLQRISKINTTILIIDPVPGLFWDATFNHVKLYYRSKARMDGIMGDAGFCCVDCSADYLLQVGVIYMVPLSYACIYKNFGSL